MTRITDYRPILGLLFVMLFCIAVYYPGLHGDFVFDDEPNILLNEPLHITTLTIGELARAATSGPSGLMGRPLTMITFGINHALCGLDATCFKATNLGLHLFSGLFFFLILNKIKIILESRAHGSRPALLRWLPLLATAFWMLATIQLTSVLYIVQRMALLSGLISLMAICLYMHIRTCALRPSMKVLLLALMLSVMVTIGALAKENAVLIPVYAFLLEKLVLTYHQEDTKTKEYINNLFFWGLWIPTIIFISHAILSYRSLLADYAMREFSLYERLLTESRVLLLYARLIVLPDNSLLGLFHDDLELSRGLFRPITTFVSINLLAIVTALSYAQRKRMPYLAIGLSWYLLGHSIESTVLPLELMHEHRNYLASGGLAIIIAAALIHLPVKRTIIIASTTTYIVLTATMTLLRAQYWSDESSLAIYEVTNHPKSASANYSAGRVLLNAYQKVKQRALFERGLGHLEIAATITPQAQYIVALVFNKSSSNQDYHQDYVVLLELLKNSPIHPMAVNGLRSLANCQRRKICQLSEEELSNLINAAINNKSLSGVHLAAALTLAVDYTLNTLGSLDSAIALAQKAVEIAPRNVQYKLNLTTAFIAANRLNEASALLKKIQDQDYFGAHAEEIGSRLSKIEAARNEIK